MSRRGRPRSADDGERRDHVGRRHDGAEHEAERERHAEQIMRHGRHRAGGEDDAAESEQRDRAQIEAEFAPAHGDAGRIDQRRQDAEQHQFGRQLDARQAGNQSEPDAGDDEKNGRRGVEPPRHDGDDHQHREQEQYRLDRRRHGSDGLSPSGWSSASERPISRGTINIAIGFRFTRPILTG